MRAVFGLAGVSCLFLTIASVVAQPFGLTNREANTTLRFPSSPPVFGYSSSNALGSLTFMAPVAIVSAPGETNRVFVIEESGRIVVITNLANPTRTVFIDLTDRVRSNGEEGLLGLAFHPGYVTNRFFYVFYVLYTNTTIGASTRHDRLSRFEISPSNTNQGLSNTEVVLINQKDDFSNHNAGDIHFGADGYLYVSLGDEGDANDTGANSQRIDKDFFSGIIRIDVDKLPGSLAPTAHPASSTNYTVPADNPFIGATTFNGLPLTGNVRTEFWAVGLRNPWRWSFDPATGLLYCGDVGQSAREEVDIIVKGGNYGWNYREGYIAGPRSPPPAGFTETKPILDYQRTPGGATNVGYSITGGVVYHGDRLGPLDGAYIFGDYGSGNIWALRYDGSVATNVPFWRLMGDPGISAFGIDPSNGDVLYCDVAEGIVKRLRHAAISGGLFPPTLADAGIFSDVATMTPNAGVIAYDVNVPSWADDAEIHRWFSIPPTNSRITYRAPVAPFIPWSFPSPTVWIQHFDMELTNGAPDSRHRIETRALVRFSGGAYGLSYRWDDSQTNATLVGEAGASDLLTINDGGILRTQVWRFPSRTDCAACHDSRVGFALGFNTPQFNRDFNYGGVVDNQLRALNNAGYFTNAITDINSLPRMARPDVDVFSVEHRARSYLMANCAHCHLGAAAGVGLFDARIYRAISDLNIVNGTLINTLGNPNNRVVKPGVLDESMLLTRMSTLGTGRMPPVGNSTLDTQAIALVNQWITNDLPAYQSFAQWQLAYFGSTNATDAARTVDPDGDSASNFLEWLTHTDPTNAVSRWDGLTVGGSPGAVQVRYERVANRGFELQYNTNITNGTGWRFLDVPENRPFFAATNGTTAVTDTNSALPEKYYRARVYEP